MGDRSPSSISASEGGDPLPAIRDVLGVPLVEGQKSRLRLSENGTARGRHLTMHGFPLSRSSSTTAQQVRLRFIIAFSFSAPASSTGV